MKSWKRQKRASLQKLLTFTDFLTYIRSQVLVRTWSGTCPHFSPQVGRSLFSKLPVVPMESLVPLEEDAEQAGLEVDLEKQHLLKKPAPLALPSSQSCISVRPPSIMMICLKFTE